MLTRAHIFSLRIERYSGNRTGASCPVCGESFETDQHLLRHIRYLQWEEAQVETANAKSEIESMEAKSSASQRQTLKAISFTDDVTRSNDDLSGYLTESDADGARKNTKDVHFHGTVNRLSNLRQIGRSRARTRSGKGR